MTDISHHPREEHSGGHKDRHHRHCFGRRHHMLGRPVPNSLEHSRVHATCGRGHRETEWTGIPNSPITSIGVLRLGLARWRMRWLERNVRIKTKSRHS